MNMRHIAFGAALFLQITLLALVPAQHYRPILFGDTVYLKVQPYDPYDIMRGYYAVMKYDVAMLPPEWQNEYTPTETPVYVVIEPSDDGRLWNAVAATRTWPDSISESQRVLKGVYTYNEAYFGIEEFFLPESQHIEFDENFREHSDTARAIVKVDGSGYCVLTGVEINGKLYGRP